MGVQRSKCKYCGRPILWVRTTDGKTMPIDPDPTPTGNVVAEDGTDGPRARVLTTAMEFNPAVHGHRRYTPHFATCPKLPKGRHRSERSSTNEDPS